MDRSAVTSCIRTSFSPYDVAVQPFHQISNEVMLQNQQKMIRKSIHFHIRMDVPFYIQKTERTCPCRIQRFDVIGQHSLQKTGSGHAR